MDDILVPTSPGELIDKLTILRLKTEKITDPAKLANVRHEYATLQAAADAAIVPSDALAALWGELYVINSNLWQIEDDIRASDAADEFGPRFVRLARAVYITNDKRSDLKKRINTLLGSALVEEKSYVDHKSKDT